MAAPLILIPIAVGTALYGLYKGIRGAADQSTANEVNDSAVATVDRAKRKVEEQRRLTEAILEDYGSRKLRAFNGVIAEFIQTFGRLKNVEDIQTPGLDHLSLGSFSKNTLQGLRDDYALLKSSGIGLGSGLGGGAALAFGAYNGTMLLATASTGTAISTLSGAAATNATLAWLGGGSIAAGGGGVALGTAVLGGIVVGPALAIFGHIVGAKGEEALNTARSNMEQARTFAQEAELTCTKLEAIQKVTASANATFSKVSTKLRRAVRDLKAAIEAHGDNYADFPPAARQVVFRAVKYTQLLKALIDTPILDADGSLVASTAERVKNVGELAG